MEPKAAVVPDPQSADAVLMVRPARFAFNPQTAASNAFQSQPTEDSGVVAAAVLREFDGLADALVRAGVEVIVVEDTASPAKPDAVFPNNWVSFHRDGSVVLYPMLAPNRRLERREEIVQRVVREGRYHIGRTVDLSPREEVGEFLEGTGSMVLDRCNRIAYAALSPRTDLDVLGDFAQQLDYDLVAFDTEVAGRSVYHTNVLMGVGARFAVVCAEAIAALRHRSAVVGQLTAGGHEVIDISLAQMHAFAGNLLELAPPQGNVIALSSTAWASLDAAQRRRLEAHGALLVADIPLIERFGGGGVRCMLAEIHLPKRA